MARNNRFSTTSGPGRENKRPGKSNPRNRDDRKDDRKSSKPFSDRSAGPGSKKDFRKKDDLKSPGQGRPKASPFYKDRGYGSPERREPKDAGDFKNKSPEKRDRKEGAAPKKTGFKRKFDEKKGNFRPRPVKPVDFPEKGHDAPKERKSFIESRLEKQRQSRVPAAETAPKDDLIRLNKFISNSGVCSRREADELISMGLITVNGKSITELGYKVKPTDDVRHDGKKLKAEKPVYILLNKPKGYITTTDDPQERNTVMKLIEGACKERIYPVGRLDRNTSGLLLLTNDGELTDKLSHPRNNVKKIYKAELDKPLTKADAQKILDGVHLEEGRAMVDDLAIISEDGKTVGIEIHIGWNRIIRRIFETLGYDVVKLDRSVYAGLDKKELSRGHWRFLRQDEVIRLKHFQ
jgi:23S rRNA pseudouridine2605 synthase